MCRIKKNLPMPAFQFDLFWILCNQSTNDKKNAKQCTDKKFVAWASALLRLKCQKHGLVVVVRGRAKQKNPLVCTLPETA